MKINSDLGYEPVTYSELTTDEEFWKGCRSCVNFEILTAKQRKNCMCNAMLFDPVEAEAKIKEAALKKTAVIADGEPEEERRQFKGNFKLFERWVRFKQFVLLKSWKKKQIEEGKKPSVMSFFFFW